MFGLLEQVIQLCESWPIASTQFAFNTFSCCLPQLSPRPTRILNATDLSILSVSTNPEGPSSLTRSLMNLPTSLSSASPLGLLKYSS